MLPKVLYPILARLSCCPVYFADSVFASHRIADQSIDLVAMIGDKSINPRPCPCDSRYKKQRIKPHGQWQVFHDAAHPFVTNKYSTTRRDHVNLPEDGLLIKLGIAPGDCN